VLGQPVVTMSPQRALLFEPLHGRFESVGVQGTGSGLGVATAAHELGPLKDLDVFGDRLRRQRERSGKLTYCRVSSGELPKDGPAGGVRQSGERGAELV
jgi:hypothetical protein